MEGFLITLGITLGSLILIYIIGKLISGPKILESSVTTSVNEITDHYYYLPGFSLTITATATVSFSRITTSKEIKDPKLNSLVVTVQSQIEPDSEQLIFLKYTGSAFSHDEIKVTTSTDGLVENILATTDDRIENIIVDLVKKVPATEKDGVESQNVSGTRETITASKVFKVPIRYTKQPSIACTWQLLIDNPGNDPKPLNISFNLKQEDHLPGRQIESEDKFSGVFTRAVKNTSWTVHTIKDLTNQDINDTSFNAQEETRFSAIVPNYSSLLRIPIKRSLFVKKVQLPKFSKGLLIENYINKPSEIESIASIPVNIAKAIMSIPSALLQFKITHLKQETEYEKAMQELDKLKKPSEPTSKLAPAKDPAIDLLQKQLKELHEKLNKPSSTEKPVPKLGKLEPEEIRSRSPEVNIKEIIAKLTDLEIPTSRFWDQGFTGDWMSYNNENIQICVPAAAAHMIMCWTLNTRPSIRKLTLNQVIDAYSNESGYDPQTGENDNGCSAFRFISRWDIEGFGESTLVKFASLDKGSDTELKFAIYLFGACMIGFHMPNSAKGQMTLWDVTDPTTSQGFWGRHAVAAVGYDARGIRIISWDKVITVTWEFYKKYNDEGFAVLSQDWIQNNLSPNKQDLVTLTNLMNQMS